MDKKIESKHNKDTYGHIVGETDILDKNPFESLKDDEEIKDNNEE